MSYDDYYFYELTNQDKFVMMLSTSEMHFDVSYDLNYDLNYVFILNTYTFKEVMESRDISLFESVITSGMTSRYVVPLKIIFFGWPTYEGRLEDDLTINNNNKFSSDYGKLFRIKLNDVHNNYDCVVKSYCYHTMEEENINEDEKMLLYSKIPAWVMGKKCIELIFCMREVCKDELPEDVIKYMIQMIKN
jgi:hypothetical protein